SGVAGRADRSTVLLTIRARRAGRRGGGGHALIAGGSRTATSTGAKSGGAAAIASGGVAVGRAVRAGQLRRRVRGAVLHRLLARGRVPSVDRCARAGVLFGWAAADGVVSGRAALG